MIRKLVFLTVSTVLLLGIVTVELRVHGVEASGTIYIRADGSIDPPTANITSADNVTYYFTDNNYDEVVIERSNIIIDGNGYTLQGPGGLQFLRGVSLSGRNNVTINNMRIEGFNKGIWLDMGSDNNRLYGNNVTNNYFGIGLESSHNNTIVGNNIVNSTYGGLWLWNSSNNIIIGNNITENSAFGIVLSSSSNNMLKNNNMSNNPYNFHAPSSPNFVNDVDTSNTVDGKPVYYWISKRDMPVPLDAGYVALVNCTHMIVKNLSLTNNGHGVLLANTNNSKIENNSIANNSEGIWLSKSSSNNTISENSIPNNIIGVSLSSNNTLSENNIANSLGGGITLHMGSNNIIISRNNITESQLGIQLMASSNNTITGNNIADNKWGIQLNSGETLGYSSDNKVYHNNFINNNQQVWLTETGDIPPSAYTNSWDNGYPSGGNYWSNYTGVDLNRDGIGDNWHEIDENNTDQYPLMGMFHSFKTSLGYDVNIISNSTIESFQHFDSDSTIVIHASNMTTNQTHGFCRISIPYEVMSEPFNVTIDGTNPTYWNYALYDDGKNRWIYFEYEHTTREIVIILEFPLFLTLSPFMSATLIACIIYRMKYSFS